MINVEVDGKKVKGFVSAAGLHVLSVGFGKFEAIKEGLLECIVYVHPKKFEYISVGGTITIINDKRRLEVIV